MKRYERQLLLSEIGTTGQQKLTQAKVLVIGAGGLGCPVLQNLTAAGVGCIAIVDGDIVEETNLHRQYLYTKEDCGKSKAVVSATVLSRQNPEIRLISVPTFLTASNAFAIVADYDVIVDCTDDLAARYLINDLAVAKNIPMVYASIHKFEGQFSVFNYKNGPTYRCLFPEKEMLSASSSCNDSGVLGVLANVMGTFQANEVLKIILEIGEVLSGKLLLYNGLGNLLQNIDFQKNKAEYIKGLENGLAILNQSNVIQFGTISPADFFSEIQQTDMLLIDIRESYEEPKLEVEKCQNVPLAQLDDFLKNVDKNQKLILFCQNGNRSQLAAGYLNKKGFTNVFHLQNGIASLEKISN